MHDAPKDRDQGDDLLEPLIEQCLAAPETERLRLLEAICSTHPEQAAALRERVRLLRAFGCVFEAEAPPLPTAIGEFEIVRRLGEGGMGVVYEARQPSLARTVALKLIRPDQVYFDGARERFRREAQAIASLSHPNIVPIYSVGDDGGLPWFAMELVRGCTLAEALQALADRSVESLRGSDLGAEVARRAGEPFRADDPPAMFAGTWVETCVEIARQIAEALEHAHGRGIVHRDVKPSNIALAPDGRARLLDFGLTSRTEHGRLTRTGSQVGTLLYMPPEQMRGTGVVGPRADIYSLGVVCYELLTMRLPYRGDDSLAIARAAHTGNAEAIRSHNRRVPVDLQTVCMVAMDRDPGRRYAGAAAFARDLANVLAHRPIAARPPGPWVRARRFVERHPARVASVGLLLVLLVGIPLALLVQQSAYAADLAASLARVEKADAAKAEALAKERAALHETTQSLAFVTNLFLRAAPSVAKGEQFTVRDLLEIGAGEVEQALAGHPLATARIEMSVGIALHELGATMLAREQFEKASAIYRTQPDLDPPWLYGAALRRLADSHSDAGDTQAAVMAYDQALDALPFDLVAARGERAHALAGRAWLRAGGGDLDAARLDLEAARECAATAEPPPVESLADIELRFAALYVAKNRFDEARPLVSASLDALRAAPGGAGPRICEALNLRGMIAKRTGDLEGAAAAYEEALSHADTFWPTEGRRQAEIRLNLAAVEGARGNGDREIALLRRALAIFERDLGTSHQTTALCAGNLAGTLTRRGFADEAAAMYPRVIEMQKAAFGPRHVFVGYSYRNLARCTAATAAPAQTAASFLEGGSILLEAQGQESAAIEALSQSARYAMQAGDARAAEQALRAALAPAEGSLPAALPRLYEQLAAALRAEGRDDEARAAEARGSGR
ncbi:MAG TPA: serine/threonine-protein kinase [Planctomycetota bacterium]|nr:serine/threonine-protein kinase [Planctomycetota bacterium]